LVRVLFHDSNIRYPTCRCRDSYNISFDLDLQQQLTLFLGMHPLDI